MERELQNLPVWCWAYLENTRNYGGVHLTGKADACDALLKCVNTLKNLPSGSKRTIPLRPLDPKDEAKITGGQKFRCLSRLRIVIHDQDAELHQMCITEGSDVVTVDLVRTNTEPFETGLRDVKNGTGDYLIAPRKDRKRGLSLGKRDEQSLALWFWPCFGHLWPAK